MPPPHRDLDDQELFLRVRSGDKAALSVLYGRHHRGLFQYLRRWTQDPALAEDLVHDVFLKLLDPSLPFTVAGRFDVWLFRIARNHAIDRLRRHRDADLEAAGELLANEPGQLDEMVASEDLVRLDVALGTLTIAERDILLLRSRMDLSHEAMAQELGCSPGAARVRLHRALTALRLAWARLPGAEHA